MCNQTVKLPTEKQIIESAIREENLQKREVILKFVVIGSLGVGKTSIIGRYTNGEFSSSYKITIGTDFGVKSIEWDENTRINLHLWDIAGHERFGSLTGIFYRHAVGAAIVFDLTRPETFLAVPKWLDDLRRKVHLPGGHPVPVILLANKGDMTTESVPKNVTEFCNNNNIMKWFITSAKDNVQIDEAMYSLITEAYANEFSSPRPINSDIIHLSNTQVKKTPRNACCYR